MIELLFRKPRRKMTLNVFSYGVRMKHLSRVVDVLTASPIGEKVVLKGWVKAVRKMKGAIFADINDGSCLNNLQVVIPKFNDVKNLGFGSSVQVSGVIKVLGNQVELLANEVNVIGSCDVNDGYPFAPRKMYSADYVRQFLHFRTRTNKFGSLLRVRNSAMHSIHNFFLNNGFTCIHTPVLTSNDCEGAGEVFIVKPYSNDLLKNMMKENADEDEAYFNDRVFLTVSGQLHLEAVVRGLTNVYSFGPTFRAENSRSRLHLSEFYMVEAEVAFIDNLHELLHLIENFIKEVVLRVLNECEGDVKFIQKQNNLEYNVTKLLDKPFAIMEYQEVINILESNSKQTILEHGLTKEHELFLVQHNDNTPIFVINWPKHLKPFYMKESEDGTKVMAVDLLVPQVGELCGGSLREDNLHVLSKKLKEHGLTTSLSWYLELRKFGNVSSGGFGIGFERLLQFFLGIANIKDTIPFPRWPHNCKM